jgi:hypothetical protein
VMIPEDCVLNKNLNNISENLDCMAIHSMLGVARELRSRGAPPPKIDVTAQCGAQSSVPSRGYSSSSSSSISSGSNSS